MSLKSRACLACYGIGTLFTILSARLIHLAVARHDHYWNIAKNTYNTEVVIPARRGAILDVEGNSLARNEPLKNVILDGKLICEGNRKKTPQEIAELIAGPLGLTVGDVLKRISPERKYVVLKKKISEELAADLEQKLQGAGIRGITFEQNFERIYPTHQMLCHVVGFYGFEDAREPGEKGKFRGIEGIERSMDGWLTGRDGRRSFEKDGRGKELMNLTGEDRAPTHGANVRLTVNLNLQQIVESELEAACKRLRPLKATVIMMKPDTGEIMALANRPNFDLNEPGKARPEERLNHAITTSFEPGSTFKAVTCAGALNFHLATMKTEVWCENGTWRCTGQPVHDHFPYGSLTVSQIIEKSSNIGAAKLAGQIGWERFYDWVRAFGFGQRTGIALPGEVIGIFVERNKWRQELPRIAFGQSVTATPIQIITATCAIANGGRLLMPQLIHDIRDDAGTVIQKNEPQEIRRVITESTAASVRDALVKVTGAQGTAKAGHIEGYNVAGKTGTAQKYDEITRRPSHDRHVTSFVGFVPAEAPAFCLLVIFDEAKVAAHADVGGLVAAPVFHSIAVRALAHLGVAPDPVLLQQDRNQKLNLAKAGRN